MNRMWATPDTFFASQVSYHYQQFVGDTTLFLCQAVSLIMSHPNQQYVSDITLFSHLAVSSIMSHSMTIREWVPTLLYFFASLRQSHQSSLIPLPTGSEWHCFISLPGSLINPMTNRQWVTLLYMYFFARQSHQSYDQQKVSGTTLFLCQAVSSIMSHPMGDQHVSANTAKLFLCQTVSPLIPSPTVCEWYCFISLPGSLINLWPTASEWHCLISLPGNLINPMTNRQWVTLLYFIAWHPHWSHDQQKVSNTTLFLCQAVSSVACLIPWPTVCEWHCSVSLPGCLINRISWLSSHDQQAVSDTSAYFIAR